MKLYFNRQFAEYSKVFIPTKIVFMIGAGGLSISESSYHRAIPMGQTDIHIRAHEPPNRISRQ